MLAPIRAYVKRWKPRRPQKDLKPVRFCSVQGCGGRYYAKDLCCAHYNSTERFYGKAQVAFAEWCMARSVVGVGYDEIAAYLRDCMTSRGPFTVPVHWAAIVARYRVEGRVLDAKDSRIQAVLRDAEFNIRVREVLE